MTLCGIFEQLDPGESVRQGWRGRLEEVIFDPARATALLMDLSSSFFVVAHERGLGLVSGGQMGLQRAGEGELPCLGWVPASSPEGLGDPGYLAEHGTRFAYQAGAMAQGIASSRLVIALGRAGFVGSYGSGGQGLEAVDKALSEIQGALPQGPFMVNLLHNAHSPEDEMRLVSLLLERGVTTVEAAAYIVPSKALVRFRVSGLARGPRGEVVCRHRVVAKLSREEVALKFLHPVEDSLVAELRELGLVSAEQAELARRVPLADDITVEGDSGGHTDGRPLVCLIPALIALRDQVQRERGYERRVRIGAGGGIGTSAAALAAFDLGAAYIVTGSINQACLEAGTSPLVKKMLAEAEMADVMMCPSSDMFELGAKVQVLKRGTLFPVHAQKLYQLFTAHGSIEELPAKDREALERRVFKRSLDEVWMETARFFEQRDPWTLEQARADPRKKMALVFRWYLGCSSRWAIAGESGRMTDAQIWCGQSMGAFNRWVMGTPLENPERRKVAELAAHLLRGAAWLARVRHLERGLHLRAIGEVDPLRNGLLRV